MKNFYFILLAILEPWVEYCSHDFLEIFLPYGEIVIICHLSNQLTHSHLPDWLKNPTFFVSYL